MSQFETKKGTKLPITNLRGKDYLEVKYRLVWFREERPDWGVETEFTEVSNQHAVSKATIRNEQGRIVATSHKHEDKQGFGDFREKAETGAIGRALALIGYGTQFASELEEGDRIVDSPVARSLRSDPPTTSPAGANGNGYRIPFGKFNGKRIEEVPKDQLAGYVQFLQSKAHEDNKPLQGKVKELVDRAHAYLGVQEEGPTGFAEDPGFNPPY